MRSYHITPGRPPSPKHFSFSLQSLLNPVSPTFDSPEPIAAPQKEADFSLTAHTHPLYSFQVALLFLPHLLTRLPHPTLTEVAPACFLAKPRRHPFFHLLWAIDSNLLCGAARPVYGNGGAGGGRWAPGRPLAALEGEGQPAGGRWPGGAPGGSDRCAGLCDSAHRV